MGRYQNTTSPRPEEFWPVNIEAERTVLGYLIVGGVWRDDITERHFARKDHKEIWRSMATIHTRGDSINLRGVAEELGEKQLKLITVGYLTELRDGCFPEMTVESSVMKLHDAAGKRELQEQANTVMNQVQSGEYTAQQLVDRSAADLQRIKITLNAKDEEEDPLGDSPNVPAFPEEPQRGLFREYRDIMQDTTEASDAAHFATLWAAIAAALGRKVSMFAGDTIYPNCYLAVFGPSGDKKTTAERRILTCGLLADHAEVKILKTAGSTEGLARDPGASTTYVFFWEEFSSLLSRAQWSGSTLLEFITETFDCPPTWGISYKQDPVMLTNPTPTILTAITPEWFWKHAKAEDFFGGFGNRFLFLRGPKKRPISNPIEPDPFDMARIRKRLAALKELQPTRAVWTPAAAKEWDEFYNEIEGQERAGLMGAATKRLHVYARKLSMAYAAIEDTLPDIQPEQLRAAIACNPPRERMHRPADRPPSRQG